MRRAWWLGGGLALVAVIGIAVVGVAPRAEGRQVEFSDFLDQAARGRVPEVTIIGRILRGRYTDDTTFRTYAPVEANVFLDRLLEKGVRVSGRPEQPEIDPLLYVVLSWLPMVIILITLRLVGVRVVTARDAALVRRVAALEARLASMRSG